MISATDYITIANNIGNDYSHSSSIVVYLNSAYASTMGVYTDSKYSFSPDIARRELQNMSQTYNAAMVLNPTLSLNVVLALQDNVNAHYGDVNSFLSNNGIKVNQSFATLSAAVGYTINSGNIA